MFLFHPFTDRITWLLVACGFAVLMSVAGSMPSLAGQTLAGPYTATVERVVDGDTLAVRVPVWIGQELTVLVRVRGIDAPERKSRCATERALTKRASARSSATYLSDHPVRRSVRQTFRRS